MWIGIRVHNWIYPLLIIITRLLSLVYIALAFCPDILMEKIFRLKDQWPKSPKSLKTLKIRQLTGHSYPLDTNTHASMTISI